MLSVLQALADSRHSGARSLWCLTLVAPLRMFSKQVWEEQEEAERPFRASIDRRQAGRGRRNRKRVGATGDGGDVGSGSGGGERLPKSPSAGGVPRAQLPVSGTPTEGEGPPAAAPGEATSSSEASEAFVLRDASGHFVEPIDFSEAASASSSRFNPATEVARGQGQGSKIVAGPLWSSQGI